MKTWAAIWPMCIVALVFTKVDSCVTFIHICEVKRIWSAICNWTVFDPYTTFLLESGLVGWSIDQWFIRPMVRSVGWMLESPNLYAVILPTAIFFRTVTDQLKLFLCSAALQRNIGQSYPGTAFHRTEADIPSHSCRCSSLECCDRFDHILLGWPFC